MSLFRAFQTWLTCYLPVHVVWQLTPIFYLLPHVTWASCWRKWHAQTLQDLSSYYPNLTATTYTSRTSYQQVKLYRRFEQVFSQLTVLFKKGQSPWSLIVSFFPHAYDETHTTFAVFTRASHRTYFEADEGAFFLGCLSMQPRFYLSVNYITSCVYSWLTRPLRIGIRLTS
jgi:hypothetical protein